MNITLNQIQEWKSKLSFKSPTTQDYYFYIVNKFLEFTNGSIDEANIYEFLKTINPNSIQTYYYAIKFLYDSIGIPLSVKLRDVKPRTIIKRTREALSIDEVEALIKTVKKDFGIIEIGYIFISTIYGTRRIEIYNVSQEDIDEKDGTITIYTAKGGQEERKHLIPICGAEIMSEFKEALSKVKKKPRINSLNEFFDILCLQADVQLRPRLGFHSIRRTLISELLMTELNATIIRHFLRWKPREQDIILNYDIKNWKRVDEMIFQYHPFIKFWENNK